MAATFFRGQTENFGVAGNWSNGLPDSTHTPAIFDGSITQTSALTGLDRTGDTFTLVTYPNYHGKIGESGNPLIWEDSHTVMRTATIHGSGELYLECPINATGGEMVIMPSRHATVHIKAKFYRLVVGSGNVLLDAYSTFSAFLWIFGAGTRVTLPVAPGAEDGPTHLWQDGGYFVNQRTTVSGDEFIIGGGELIQEGRLTNTPYLTIVGGTVRYRPGAGYLGSQVILTGIRGLLDLSTIGEVLTWGQVVIGPEFEIDGDVQGSLSPNIDLRNRWP